MILSVFSESPADEAAIRILVAGLVEDEPVEPQGIAPPRFPGGWNSVVTNLPVVIRAVHYHTDADLLAVVLDSDKSPIHHADHELPGANPGECRLCKVKGAASRTLDRLKPRVGLPRLCVAIGLAVPCIEAWYCCGVDPHVNEAAWKVAMQSKKFPFDCNRLKTAVYGTDRPGLGDETEHATNQARRLIQNLEHLENSFPVGFGSLANGVREWKQSRPVGGQPEETPLP